MTKSKWSWWWKRAFQTTAYCDWITGEKKKKNVSQINKSYIILSKSKNLKKIFRSLLQTQFNSKHVIFSMGCILHAIQYSGKHKNLCRFLVITNLIGSNQNTIFPCHHFVLSNHTLNKYAKFIVMEAITNLNKPVAVLQGISK